MRGAGEPGPAAAAPASGAAAAPDIMHCVPSVLLATGAGGYGERAGVVVSVAPLMGADPDIDKSHDRWLHVHVRPPVRGLLKLLQVRQKI